VADDYCWGGSTIFSLANQSLFGDTDYTFNVTASSASTALQFEGFSIAGAWLLDDVSVNPSGVGVPDGGSTVCLLGFALLGLTALRRKLIC
jgi:VPDSG-CTERM motif